MMRIIAAFQLCWIFAAPVAASPEQPGFYQGIISDAHGHILGRRSRPELAIQVMDANRVDKVVVFAKRGASDEDVMKWHAAFLDRVIPAIGFQNNMWRNGAPEFMDEVRRKAASGKYYWLGEASVRGKIGGRENSAPDDKKLKELLDIAARYHLPVTIHHNPLVEENGVWRHTEEYARFIEATLAHNPRATIVWTHWCGLSTPTDIRRLLKRFPNLHCGLAWIRKIRTSLPNPVVDENARFMPGWKDLIEAYPDRFLMGVDHGAKKGQLKKYPRWIKSIRTALGGLSPKAARKVATENFHRLLQLGQK